MNYFSILQPLLYFLPMTFQGHSIVKWTDAHIGHVGAHFKALIMCKLELHENRSTVKPLK